METFNDKSIILVELFIKTLDKLVKTLDPNVPATATILNRAFDNIERTLFSKRFTNKAQATKDFNTFAKLTSDRFPDLEPTVAIVNNLRKDLIKSFHKLEQTDQKKVLGMLKQENMKISSTLYPEKTLGFPYFGPSTSKTTSSIGFPRDTLGFVSLGPIAPTTTTTGPTTTMTTNNLKRKGKSPLQTQPKKKQKIENLAPQSKNLVTFRSTRADAFLPRRKNPFASHTSEEDNPDIEYIGNNLIYDIDEKLLPDRENESFFDNDLMNSVYELIQESVDNMTSVEKSFKLPNTKKRFIIKVSSKMKYIVPLEN